MGVVDDVVDFVVGDPVVGSLFVVLLSLVVWKARRHIVRHREVGVYARRLQDRCELSETDEEVLRWGLDNRHEFQDDVGQLGEDLASLTYRHAIKNDRLVDEIEEVADQCDRLRRTWVIAGVQGIDDVDELDLASLHCTVTLGDFFDQVETIQAAAAELRRETKRSFVGFPVLVTLDVVREGIARIQRRI